MKTIIAVVLLFVGISAHAKNPGESAMHCIEAKSGNGEVIFVNNCGEKVFVIYCGDLKYAKKRCGDGSNGGYYTHSQNIAAGAEGKIHIQGRYRYFSCKGSIGFGNGGTYRETGTDSVECLER
ncbi:hypothetical protein GmRootA79_10740 [Acidovorax sp. A79]|jgi:hypothetical protein|uniref:hypothetical protein n=1 Tax=Acidovorax sp. A79 TaxID=3056107 RepID=UPI0034E8AD9A